MYKGGGACTGRPIPCLRGNCVIFLRVLIKRSLKEYDENITKDITKDMTKILDRNKRFCYTRYVVTRRGSVW